MNDVYIFDHVRTPRGKAKVDGGLHEITAAQLIIQALGALRERNRLRADGIDEFICGVATGAGEQGPTLARVAPLAAGFADSVPGLQLNRFCASGLESVAVGAAKVGVGACDMVIAGGVESMSRTRAGADGGGPWGADPWLTAAVPFVLQGASADCLATLMGVSRADLDAYALASQQRAAHAWDAGYFARSVIGVKDLLGTVVLAQDETLRRGATPESLTDLPPAFAEMGTQYGFDGLLIQRYPELGAIEHLHTVGTSPPNADGAAAVLLGNREAGERAGLKPRARIVSHCALGSEPLLFLRTPVPACEKALRLAGMAARDVDLWELNEAFAVVALDVMRGLGISHDRLNVNGGALAMGHPLGATGAMILGTLLDELERRSLATGVVTLCAAGGMASAVVIERV